MAVELRRVVEVLVPIRRRAVQPLERPGKAWVHLALGQWRDPTASDPAPRRPPSIAQRPGRYFPCVRPRLPGSGPHENPHRSTMKAWLEHHREQRVRRTRSSIPRAQVCRRFRPVVAVVVHGRGCVRARRPAASVGLANTQKSSPSGAQNDHFWVTGASDWPGQEPGAGSAQSRLSHGEPRGGGGGTSGAVVAGPIAEVAAGCASGATTPCNGTPTVLPR